jgi:hypothetical protein
MKIEQLENKVGTLYALLIDYRHQTEVNRSLSAMADEDIDSRKKLPPTIMDKWFKLIWKLAIVFGGLFILYIILTFTL